MTEFQHSIVLFTGDDGLPLEFNVRNTKDKSYLKELIEHGGGFCTQSDNAVHLISPGTKVLNVDLGKKLVSSSYIYDCVKQNYLLDVNDYVFTISEAQTSDISDEDSERLLAQKQSTCKYPIGILKINNDISPIKAPSHTDTDNTTNSNLTTAIPQILNSSSTHSESFVEGSQDVSSNIKITSHVYFGNISNALHTSPRHLSSSSKLKSDDITSGIKSPKTAKVSNDICVSLNKLEGDNIDETSVIHDVHNKLASLINHSDICEEFVLNATNLQSVDPLSPARSVQPMEITNEDNSVFNNATESSVISHKSPEKRTLSKVCEENIVSPNKISVRVEQNEIQSLKIATSPVNLSKENTAVLLCNEVNVQEIHTVVSSSQPEDYTLDPFDNMLLNKIQKSESEDEKSLSQSYTVSSSADAQITSKPCSAEKGLQKDCTALPDSPSLNADQVNESDYLKTLEAEVKEILLKPSPKSIQDKIALVKYICCAKKLPPATVLESLLTKSLNL